MDYFIVAANVEILQPFMVAVDADIVEAMKRNRDFLRGD